MKPTETLAAVKPTEILTAIVAAYAAILSTYGANFVDHQFGGGLRGVGV
jgi:hypothetical protein